MILMKKVKKIKMTAVEVLRIVGKLKSNSESRRLLKQGAIQIMQSGRVSTMNEKDTCLVYENTNFYVYEYTRDWKNLFK